MPVARPTEVPLYTTGRRLRSCEWALIVYFIYVAIASLAFDTRVGARATPFIIAAVVIVTLLLTAQAEEHGPRAIVSFFRDWLTLGLVLAAYREMDWFTPKFLDLPLNGKLQHWDRLLFDEWGFKRLVDSTGTFLPDLLELSYLLVYAVGPFTVAMVYAYEHRERIGWILFVYVAGTVASYGLFPYFPSSPPRTAYAHVYEPATSDALRRLNLFLVGGYGIHSSVFPSAHVSSAFSAAWASFLFMPQRKRLSWGLLIYAVLVALGAIYGRYHYAVDTLGGLVVSLGAVAFTKRLMKASRPLDLQNN